MGFEDDDEDEDERECVKYNACIAQIKLPKSRTQLLSRATKPGETEPKEMTGEHRPPPEHCARETELVVDLRNRIV